MTNMEMVERYESVIDYNEHYKTNQRFFDVQNEPLTVFLP
jgi:hypothetical protein